MKNINKDYSKEAIFNSKKQDNIYDLFDDIFAKMELISLINLDGNELANYGLFLYIEDIKEHLKGLELQLKREILNETLIV